MQRLIRSAPYQHRFLPFCELKCVLSAIPVPKDRKKGYEQWLAAMSVSISSTGRFTYLSLVIVHLLLKTPLCAT